jgi:alkylated DNA nucleotide flippase Atl1
MIWGFAANIPRIVHLSKKALRSDEHPDWWRYVRSDRPVDKEDPDFYDDFELPDSEISRINRELACQRLLTRDDDYSLEMRITMDL